VLPRISAGLRRGETLYVLEDADDTTGKGVGASVSLSQTLLDGATFARISGAHRGRTATELALEWTRREVVFETKRAYYNLLKTVRLREVQEEAVELAREQLRKTQSLFDLGSASKSDLLKAQVQVGESELALIAAEKSAEIARAALALQLGIDVTSDIEATDPPGMEGDGLADIDVAAALGRRPDIRAWEETVVAASRSLLASKAGRWPDLGLSVSYDRSRGTFDELFEDATEEYERSVNL
jgi:outer membrane protein TolC